MAQRGAPETVKRKELVGKLNETCLRAFSGAAQFAKSRGNPYVELAHFIDALSRSERTDFEILCQSAGVDGARLEGDIQRALDRLPHGASAVEEFSDHIFHAIREAWTYGKMEHGDDQVRSAWVLIAAMKAPVLGRPAAEDQPGVRKDRPRQPGTAIAGTVGSIGGISGVGGGGGGGTRGRAEAARQVGLGAVRHQSDGAGAGGARLIR